MSDDNDDNEKAIKKVVKKQVDDLFDAGKPEPKHPAGDWREAAGWRPATEDDLYRGYGGYGARRTATNLLKPPYGSGHPAVRAGWGPPPMRPEPAPVAAPATIDFRAKAWEGVRKRVMKATLKEMDWERIVIQKDDHVLLEQLIDTVMRRGKYQFGEEGNSFRKGSLVQVPITIEGQGPAKTEPLPASSMDLDWEGDDDGEDTEE